MEVSLFARGGAKSIDATRNIQPFILPHIL